MSSTFPFQRSIKIKDTQIICTTFTDRHFVVISQLDKFGTLIEASAEDSSQGHKLYYTNIIFGKRDDPLLTIYARQIIERIATVSEKPLLLSISLREETRDSNTFQEVLNQLFEIATWY